MDILLFAASSLGISLYSRRSRRAQTHETTTLHARGYRVSLVGPNNTPYPPFMVPSIVPLLQERHTLNKSDIVIATFPKCGTTWGQQIVLEALKKHEKNDDDVRDPWKKSCWNEQDLSFKCANASPQQVVSNYISTITPTSKRRVIKTHAPYDLKPWSSANSKNNGKVIVITRNPFDAAISMFHHACDVDAFAYDGSSGGVDEFINDLYLPGKVESGDFWGWVKGWRDAFEDKNNDNIFWISYEELTSDPISSVTSIVDFLDLTNCNETDIKEIVAASSFNKMKKNFAINDAARVKRGEKVKPNHIRKGGVGGFKKILREDTQIKMTEHHCRRCEELSLDIELFSCR